MGKHILTINAGSSSIKFAIFSLDDSSSPSLHGTIERIGLPGPVLVFSLAKGNGGRKEILGTNAEAAIETLRAFLAEHVDFDRVIAVGHRIVHGMGRNDHAIITRELIRELEETRMIDPEHFPLEIAIIKMFAKEYPELVQVSCFDTIFHHDMPRVAQLLPLPRRFDVKGVRRYGFHGLSCAYLMEELRRLDPSRVNGRVIIAHLGNGASITAIRDGKSVDTSMGFTPVGGIPMSSRTGDIDPGALLYIMKNEGLSLIGLNHLIGHEAGLLGVSETSSDMERLLSLEAIDERAKEAIDLFCYEAKKRIGAYAAVLGGVETLIFSGGMGEHAPRIRTRICRSLQFLGIDLDEEKNQANEQVISTPPSSACVRMMHTDEELMIARITRTFVTP